MHRNCLLDCKILINKMLLLAWLSTPNYKGIYVRILTLNGG
jgi:hypothetical protein